MNSAYKVNCREHNKVCIGRTENSFWCRIKEHTVGEEERRFMQTGHIHSTEILKAERNLNQRKPCEGFDIKTEKKEKCKQPYEYTDRINFTKQKCTNWGG